MGNPEDRTEKEGKKTSDDLVITPAGPRRKSQVHPVKPGETIRRNPDGTYTTIPKKKDKNK